MKDLTVRDVIEMTINDLKQIKVPAEYLDEIGLPVRNALHNLGMCLEAIDREMAAAQQAEEPVIELFAGDGEVPAEENQDE